MGDLESEAAREDPADGSAQPYGVDKHRSCECEGALMSSNQASKNPSEPELVSCGNLSDRPMGCHAFEEWLVCAGQGNCPSGKDLCKELTYCVELASDQRSPP